MDKTLCPNCSVPLSAGSRFCNQCGASLSVQPMSSEGVPEKEAAQGDGGVSPKRSQSIVPAVNGGPALFRQSVGLGQRIWDMITMGGCTGVAGLWYWYSGMAETAPDYKTCAATVLLPLALIIFRQQIDRVLMPIQKTRRKIPPMVRLGVGLAMPFLISNYLYAKGFTQFDFMFKTVVLSTLSTFVILRNPVVPKPNLTQRGLR